MVSRRFRYDPETDSVVEVGGPGRLRKAGAWAQPKHCEALAVDPDEVKWEKMLDQEQGLGDVEYDKNGCPVFYSPGKYDEYVRAKGYVNKSSCGKHPHFSPELFERIVARQLEEDGKNSSRVLDEK